MPRFNVTIPLYTILFFGSLLLGCVAFFIHHNTIDFSALQQDVFAKPSILLDDQGNEWGRFQQDKRSYVLLETMPEHLIHAFLATEDRTFFQHPGISFRGIIRSVIINICRGKRVQGASTITQQLVRLLFLESKKTFFRKFKEQLYAILVERQWSKEQILEAYLNNVYFGYGIYGVQAACQRFWGKDVSEITLEESAVLASIMKSPHAYSPIHAPKAVVKRRNLILNLMLECNTITKEQCLQAQQTSLFLKEPDVIVIAPHFKEMIRIFLEKMIGKQKLYTGGFIIQTTLNSETQQAAQQAFHEHIGLLRKTKHQNTDGALVSLDRESGQIKAMIGGFDFQTSKYNRAIQARRQMGSVFKVLVYAAALEQGLLLTDIEIDEPFEFVQNGTTWKPENHTKEFLGPMTRAFALSYSNNIVAIKTLLATGANHVIDLAQRCGISAPMQPYPSLALGCTDVHALETAAAFNVITNHGIYVQPYAIEWIKNNNGKKIYKATTRKQRVISSSITSQINRVLMFSIERLKQSIGQPWFGGQAIGKTGTNNDFRTSWFVGATPELTTAIYVGCDHNESMGQNIYGSKTSFPIWFKMHCKIAKNKTNFYYDPHLKEQLINWRTGEFTNNWNDPDVVPLLVT